MPGPGPYGNKRKGYKWSPLRPFPIKGDVMRWKQSKRRKTIKTALKGK